MVGRFPFICTALRDLRRSGSSNDAEITERVRTRPTLIEWESSWRCSGEKRVSSVGEIPDAGAVW